MAKTNLELAQQAVNIISDVNDSYSFFEEIDDDYRIQLMKSAPIQLHSIFSKLASNYAPKVELESVVEIAEDKDWFDKSKFSGDDMVIFEGKEYNIAGIDFETKAIEILKDNEHIWLISIECIYLPKK